MNPKLTDRQPKGLSSKGEGMKSEIKISKNINIKIEWKWSEDYLNVLTELIAQGVKPIRAQIGHIELSIDDGIFCAVLEPLSRPKDKYQLEAKLDCKACSGNGYITYVWDQDDIKSTPCYLCFPNSEWAQRAHKEWIEKEKYR